MTIELIELWHKRATEQRTPSLGLVLGIHLEEVAELAQGVGEHAALAEVESLATNLKTGFIGAECIDRVALLDSLCDQIFTAVGVGVACGFDMHGAMAEVIRSNWSKADPATGRFKFDQNGKIAKDVGYSGPELAQFV